MTPDTSLTLKNLRSRAAVLNASLVKDLGTFYGTTNPVFRRLPNSDELGNVTTTCSCLMGLATLSQLNDFCRVHFSIKPDEIPDHLQEIFSYAVASSWKSSGLKDDNAFTALIVLRTAGMLVKAGYLLPSIMDLKHGGKSLSEISSRIARGVPDTFQVEKYPSSPTLAYWFVDAVSDLGIVMPEEVWNKLTAWTSKVFARQVSLVASSNDAMKDPVQMAVASCLATRLRKILTSRDFTDRDDMLDSLPTRVEVEEAILKSFAFQEKSGIWPKYFPLFNYKKEGVGSNYLFSFELLEIIIHEFGDSTLLESPLVLDALDRALDWAERNRLIYFREGHQYEGWNSGGQITTLSQGKPESWATAVVHMFLGRLRLSISRLIEEKTLQKYGSTRHPHRLVKDDEDWKKFMNSPVELQGKKSDLRKIIQDEILSPLENFDVDKGSGRKITSRHSVLIFGPPGTAKTSLVRAIARNLGWPLVELNPSHFLKHGLEKIYAQVNEVFEDLSELRGTVIFFDEMDAVAKKREDGIDALRQFLTTSMLPKLSLLHDEGQAVFFMATNHQDQFDDAIKRPGRFDLLLFMGPSPWVEKLASLGLFLKKETPGPAVDRARTKLTTLVPPGNKYEDILDLFTFGEFKSFLEVLTNGTRSADDIEAIIPTTFNETLTEWSDKYIVLRSGSVAKKDYEDDRLASRLQ